MDCNIWPPDYFGKKSIELMLLFVSLKLKATLNWTINEFICSESLEEISIYWSHLFVYLESRHLNELTWILLLAWYFLGGLYALIKKIFHQDESTFESVRIFRKYTQNIFKIFVPDVLCVERKLFWQGGLSVTSLSISPTALFFLFKILTT